LLDCTKTLHCNAWVVNSAKNFWSNARRHEL